MEEVGQVLHMNGGVGEASYAQNSLVQKKTIAMTQPIKEEAIQKIHKCFPAAKCLSIADLGCSSGPNTLFAIHKLVTSIYNVRRQLSNNQSPVSIQVFLNDLPGNDFNTIFRALPSFKKELRNEIGDGFGRCFFYGIPGSFYDQLFEPQSLHFVHSSYSLHWLSRVPKGIGKSNKSNICLSSESPASVIKAYHQQFQTDIASFLRHRSEELVIGGCMVFTLLGRSDDPCVKGSTYIYDLLGLVLHQMVHEGLIKEETLELFNIPLYAPSPTEMEMEVRKEISFDINRLQVSEVDWEAAAPTVNGEPVVKGQVGPVMKCMRAVLESMLADYFGQGLMEELFRRYGEVLGECMAKERAFFTNITLSLTKTI